MSLPDRLTFRHGGRAHEHHKTFRKRMRRILSISMKHTLTLFTALGNAADPLEPNVRAFGAKGDGSTDDTAAFHTEIADGVKLKLPVRVPQGSYVITQPLALKAQRLTGEPNATFVAPALMIGGGEIVSITGNAIDSQGTGLHLRSGCERLVYSSNAVRFKGQPVTDESGGKGRFVLQGNAEAPITPKTPESAPPAKP
jgi:hypothetical protein